MFFCVCFVWLFHGTYAACARTEKLQQSLKEGTRITQPPLPPHTLHTLPFPVADVIANKKYESAEKLEATIAALNAEANLALCKGQPLSEDEEKNQNHLQEEKKHEEEKEVYDEEKKKCDKES